MSDVVMGTMEMRETRRNSGRIDLASFSCSIRGITLRGCLLAISAAGDLVTYGPNHHRSDIGRIGASVNDPVCQHEMTVRAVALYRQMGGRFGMDLEVRPPEWAR